MNDKFYEIEVLNQDGSKQDLSSYKGKVLLIVNTATRCGFTPQYKELEAIYKEYKDKGFEILDFPCNQFANQAKGTDEEINQFCTLKYDTTFKRFKKVEVIGENKCDLFKYLTENAKYEGKGFKMGLINKISKAKDDEVRWNFTKFLIDKEGNLIKRFEPVNKLEEVKEAIENLLN